jgi:integral membrane sensor domain MASE1
MTSPSGKDPHAAVLVAEPVLVPLQRLPDLLLAVAAVSLLVFAGPTALFSFHPLAYTVFPFVIWAALRFGLPAATLRTFVASGLAIWGTVGGYENFSVSVVRCPMTSDNGYQLQGKEGSPDKD